MKLQDSFANYSKVQEFQTSYMGILENSAWADPDHIHQTMREHSAIVIPITCVLFNSYREKGRLRLRSNAVMTSDSLRERLSDIFLLLGISDRLEKFRNLAEEIPAPEEIPKKMQQKMQKMQKNAKKFKKS